MWDLVKQGGLAVLLLTSAARAEGPPSWMLSPARTRLLLLDAVLTLERAIQETDRALRRLTLAEQLHPLPDPHCTNPAPRGRGASNAPSGNTTSEAFRQTQQGPFDDLILAAAVRFSLDPFLLKGLLSNESNLEPLSSGKRQYAQHGEARVLVAGGAIGIAQFTGGGIRAVNSLRLVRARRSGQVPLRFDAELARVPTEAIPAAAEFLAFLLRRYGRDGGVTAYNTGLGGGHAVRRLGFWRARRAGKLSNQGIYLLQGHRFLLNVLRHTNRYRVYAGLLPLPLPRDEDRTRRRPPTVALRPRLTCRATLALRVPRGTGSFEHGHAFAE